VTRRLSFWLLLSLGVHAVLVGLVLLLIGLSPRPLPMLFVDLVQGFLGASGPAADAGDSDGQPAGAARGPAPAAPGRRELRAPGSRLPAAAVRPAPATDRAGPPRQATPGSSPSPERASPAERAVPPEVPQPAAPPRDLALVEPPGTESPPVPAEPGRAVATPGLSASSPAVVIAPPAQGTGDGLEATPRAAGPGSAASSAPSGGSGGGTSGGRGAAGTAPGGGRTPVGDGPGLGVGARDGSVLALAIPGDGTGIGGEYQGYARLLRRRVQETLIYPPAALRRQLTGNVELRVTVDSAGAITEVTLGASSTHRLLDDAAMQAAREVGRVPFPPEVAPRPLRIRLPVVFDLR
jgi:TonB family protein